MLYGDRGYCIAHAYSRTKEALGRASRSEIRGDQAKDEDKSSAPEAHSASSAGRGVSAVRPRRLRRTT